jgi:hypothetical protein
VAPRARLASSAVFAALSLGYAAPALAQPPVPSCKGHNPTAAATAKAEGIKHYRASKREGRDDAEMAAALGFFEAACAAGDDTALELRAYALAGVERFVEAAQTLDVFLDGHPLEVLPAATKARVAAQQPEILARVATLSIETPTQGAKVSVNHQVVGTTPLPRLRLAPGRYDVEVAPEGEPPITRSIDLVVGEHTESFAPAQAKPEVVAETKPPPTSGGSGIGAPVLGAAIAGGAFLLMGVGGTVWANERAGVYNDAQCDGTSKSGCPGALSEYNAARDIEIVGFVGAGLGLVGAGVLYFVLPKRAPAKDTAPPAQPASAGDAASATWSCSFQGAFAGCSGTF